MSYSGCRRRRGGLPAGGTLCSGRGSREKSQCFIVATGVSGGVAAAYNNVALGAGNGLYFGDPWSPESLVQDIEMGVVAGGFFGGASNLLRGAPLLPSTSSSMTLAGGNIVMSGPSSSGSAGRAKGVVSLGEMDYTMPSGTVYTSDLSKAAEGVVQTSVKIAPVASNTGSYAVYQGLDAANTVRYVGITKRLPSLRFSEHLNSTGTGKEFLRYEVIEDAQGLLRNQARTLEQTLINQYGMQRNGGLLLNKVNSIAPKYWWQYGIK